MRVSPVEVARESVIFAAAEMRATHTWRTYVFGWLLRLFFQTIFFALVAGHFGTRATMQYSLVGNAVILGCMQSMIVVLMMAQERLAGTLLLLAAAPASHVSVYLGRGVHWMASGMVSAMLAFAVLPPLLGVPLPWPRAALAMLVIPLVCVASYCYGCMLGAVALRHISLTWLLLNLGYVPIMAFCGINVPVAFWPQPLRAIAGVLPVTHGLSAMRSVLSGAPAGAVLGQVALEVLVGVSWLCVAWYALARTVATGLIRGTLDFGS